MFNGPFNFIPYQHNGDSVLCQGARRRGIGEHAAATIIHGQNIGIHGADLLTWVCLKIGYIPNYSHLIGIMIINHWV